MKSPNQTVDQEVPVEGDHAASEHVELNGDAEKVSVVQDDEGDEPMKWSWKEIAAVVSLCGVYSGSQVPLYMAGGSLSYMAVDLGASSVGWLPTAYTLALAAFCPFCGYLQDMFGKRYIAILGSVFTMLGSALVATSRNFGQGVTGMAIAGCGASISELTALAGVAEIVPVQKRGLFIGIVTLSMAPFFPYVLYTQLLSSNVTWRWCMWIPFIWNGIFFAGILIFYFPQSRLLRSLGMSRWEAAKKLDYGGAALSIGGVILLLIALQSGGSSHPWTSAYVLSMLLIGVALIGCFGFWEWKVTKNPIVPKEMFAGQRVVGTALGIAFISGMTFYSLINFAPLVFTYLYSWDPIQIGLMGLGYAPAVSVGAAFMNAMLTFLKGRNREILLVSCVLMTAFTGSLASLTPSTSAAAVALTTIAGFGVGGVIVPSATIAMTACPDSLIASVTALTLTVRFLGGAIGYSIYYNVFAQRITPGLPAKVAEYVLQAGLPASSAEEFVTLYLTVPAKVSSVVGVTPDIVDAAAMGAKWAYTEALKYVWYVSIPFGVLSIIGCLCIGDISRFMTNRVAVKIRH